MRISALTTAAALAATLAVGAASPATAAAHHDNVLRGFCTTSRTTECVQQANDDDGIVFRDSRGHRFHPRSAASALRYLRHHAVPCRQEDSAACYWDASRGNGVGDSFMVTGGHAEGTGTVFYLYLA